MVFKGMKYIKLYENERYNILFLGNEILHFEGSPEVQIINPSPFFMSFMLVVHLS